MIYPIESETDRSNSLAYMADQLKGTLLFEHMGKQVFQDECLEIKIITAPGLPPQQPYCYSWGVRMSAAIDGLINEIIAYLQAKKDNLVIIEDPDKSPSCPAITEGAVGPAWFYKNQVLWPITQKMATTDLVKEALMYGFGAGWNKVGFCRHPAAVLNASKDMIISEEALFDICSSMSCLAIDIFDGEGFLVWIRKGWEDLGK